MNQNSLLNKRKRRNEYVRDMYRKPRKRHTGSAVTTLTHILIMIEIGNAPPLTTFDASYRIACGPMLCANESVFFFHLTNISICFDRIKSILCIILKWFAYEIHINWTSKLLILLNEKKTIKIKSIKIVWIDFLNIESVPFQMPHAQAQHSTLSFLPFFGNKLHFFFKKKLFSKYATLWIFWLKIKKNITIERSAWILKICLNHVFTDEKRNKMNCTQRVNSSWLAFTCMWQSILNSFLLQLVQYFF